MTYPEKLRDPRWQKKRLEIFQRDNWRCTKCGATERSLQIHHLFYLSDMEPWEYDQTSLVTLCDNCHAKEQTRPKYEEHLLQALRMKNFSAYEILGLSTAIHSNDMFCITLRQIIKRI